MTDLNLNDYPEIVLALSDPLTVKVLGTIGSAGEPRLAVKSSIRLAQNGVLTYDELIETSRTNANMVRALWFNHKVAVSLIAPNARAWLLSGRPDQVLIAGRKFQERYQLVRQKNPESGLAAVWFIVIEDLEETTLTTRRAKEEAERPLLIHLDRLL
ncbi:MAG: hypothetical protein LBS60_10945 [Deltaproteobacteria bacterium]|jgi:hypothetical protein|nr:hypothetical protein [Deltaproteobacteria bacterium]